MGSGVNWSMSRPVYIPVDIYLSSPLLFIHPLHLTFSDRDAVNYLPNYQHYQHHYTIIRIEINRPPADQLMSRLTARPRQLYFYSTQPASKPPTTRPGPSTKPASQFKILPILALIAIGSGSYVYLVRSRATPLPPQ